MDFKQISSRFRQILSNKSPSASFAAFLPFLNKKPAGPVVETSYRLACDLGKTKIVFLEMMKSGDVFTVTQFHKMPRPKENKELIEALWKAITLSGFKTNRVRASVKGQGVIVRFVQFPKMSPEELRSAITYEAEKYIPFKADEVIVDHHVLDEAAESNGGASMNVLLVAVKKEEIYSLVGLYKEAGLQVEFIDVDALAFFNAMEYLYPQEFQSSLGILDIGSEITTLGIVKEGKPQFIRDISYGAVDIAKKLKRKSNLSMEQALEQLEIDRKPSPEMQQDIVDSLGPLVSDLKISLDYYLDQVQITASLQKIFMSGGAGYQPLLLETLSKDLGIQITPVDIRQKIQLGPDVDPELVKNSQAFLPIALGLCLR